MRLSEVAISSPTKIEVDSWMSEHLVGHGAYWRLHKNGVVELGRTSGNNPVVISKLNGKLPPFKIAFAGRSSLCFNKNELTSLHNIHEVLVDYPRGEMLWINDNPIVSHMLGLMLIPGLQNVSHWRRVAFNQGNPVTQEDKRNLDLYHIINRHLGKRDNVIDLQHDLIEHGFDEYAQL